MMKKQLLKIIQFISGNWWGIVFFILFIPGIILSVKSYHFIGEREWNDSIYQTIRLFQIKDNPGASEQLTLAKWLLCLAFFWLSLKVFLTIVAPHYLTEIYIRWFFRNHVVICGLNETTMYLIDENPFDKKRVVVIANRNNPLLESITQRRIRVIYGDCADKKILNKAGIIYASHVYAITYEDKKNVEIARNIYTLLESNFQKRDTVLKCYTIIRDRELKILLEETALFKHPLEKEGKFRFDGIIFNINETGTKYGISKNIRYILPQSPEFPNILIIGLSDKAECTILSLAHCFTLNRDCIRFTIIEDDESLIKQFKQKFSYLQDFVEFEYHSDINAIELQDKYSSVFICYDHQIDNIKESIPVRCAIAKDQPSIFMLCDEPEDLNDVLNAKGNDALSLSEKNIFLINLFEETVKYIIHLDANIEAMAGNAHNMWREKNTATGEYLNDDRYETIPEHFKQSNRNLVLDNYIKTHIVRQKIKSEERQDDLISFSDRDKETLAMIEHRRWMIEKYINGWKYGANRDDSFKIHTMLKPWKELSEEEKMKDYRIIDLMISELNKQY